MTTQAEPGAPPRTHTLDTTCLLRAARGFSAAFWGFAITFFLLTGVLSVRPLLLLPLPAHTVGVALLLLSTLWFLRSRLPGARWQRWSRQYALATALQLYLLPFLGWWSTAARHPLFFGVNIALLIAATLWLLVLVHLLALETAQQLGDRVLLIEVRICLWIFPVLVGLSVALFVLGSVWLAGGEAESLPWMLRSAALTRHAWSYLPAALPFVLALAVTWEAKERCLFHIQQPPVAMERA